MGDLYKKENPFISTVVEPNIGSFEKDRKNEDVEATPKISSEIPAYDIEKGIPHATLTPVDTKPDKKTRVRRLKCCY